MEEQSMRHIVERCQQGDREAFGLLYTAMSDRLCHVCRRYVADEDVINDLLHDTFILIFSKIKTLNEDFFSKCFGGVFISDECRLS